MRTFALILAFAVAICRCDNGPSDYAALDAVRSGKATDVLKMGATGASVTALQNALAGSCHPVPMTAVFDNDTYTAVCAFQKQWGLDVDGAVGPTTMDAFDKELGIAAHVSPGLRRIGQSEVTAEITKNALEILHANGSNPIGSEYPFTTTAAANSSSYVGRVELHFHPFGGEMKPWGYHHGISIFAGTIRPGHNDNDTLVVTTAKPSSLRVSGMVPRQQQQEKKTENKDKEEEEEEGGSAFLVRTAAMSPEEREEAIFEALAKQGNIPDFLRQYVQITVLATSPNSDSKTTTATTNVTFFVLPDYMAIGGDKDYVRIPMWAPTVQKLADLWNGSVPTTRMVDLIWKAADVHVQPVPLPPTDQMRSNAWIEKEQVATQLELAAVYPAASGPSYLHPLLLGGNKKDIVITNLLQEHPDRVAIYGWHFLNGSHIQPLTVVHGANYSDYSHGMRLVSQHLLVDGTEMRLDDFLQDADLAPILSEEGVVGRPRIPSV